MKREVDRTSATQAPLHSREAVEPVRMNDWQVATHLSNEMEDEFQNTEQRRGLDSVTKAILYLGNCDGDGEKHLLSNLHIISPK